MAPVTNGTHGNATPATNVVYGQQPSTDDRNKTLRHPRWTRRETMVLIEGKKIAEERGRRGRRSSSVLGEQIEPKWDSVSSHCRQHGVDRGPLQCRKRWSNLVSDYKKIKTWESQGRGEAESFWTLRSDLRREVKLPGFFDREIYDVLDGKPSATAAYQLALVPVSPDEKIGDGVDGLDGVEVEYEDEVEETEEEFEQVAQEEINGSRVSSPVPISEVKYHTIYHGPTGESSRAAQNKRKPGSYFWRDSESREGTKRGRQSSNDGSDSSDSDVEESLIETLKRNTNLLSLQLEEQKLNFQLDREQRKNQHDSIIAALAKVTEALEKIANKL